MELTTLYFEGKLDLKENSDKFIALIDAITELTPTELYVFLCSLNFLYGDAANDKYVFNYATDIRSILTYLMAFYTVDNFTGDARNTLADLFLAMEKCALIEVRADGLKAFRDQMTKLNASYSAMNAEEKALFNQIAGDCYQKYLALNAAYGNETHGDLGEDSAKFNELKDDLVDFFKILEIVYDANVSNEDKQYVYGLIFPLAEQILTAYNDLLQNGSADTVKALCTTEYTFGTVKMPIDSAIFRVKNEFYYNTANRTVSYGNGTISLWIIYRERTALRSFMIEVSDLLISYRDGKALDATMVKGIIEGFRALDGSDRSIFYMFGMNVYYDALLNFFTSQSVNETLARAILQMEIGYVEYLADTTDESRREYFKNIVENAKSQYPKNDSSLNQLIKDFYNFYLAKYNEAFKSESSDRAA